MIKFNQFGIPKKLTKKYLKDKSNDNIDSIETDRYGDLYYDYNFFDGETRLRFWYYPKKDAVSNIYLRDKEGDIQFEKMYLSKFIIDIVSEFSNGLWNLDEINKMEEYYRK